MIVFKRYLLNLRLNGVVIAQLLVLSSCGGTSSETLSSITSQSGNTEETTESPSRQYFAEDLGLRIVLEDDSGANPNIPDPSASLSKKSALDIYSANQDEIRINSKLFLADPQSHNPDKQKGAFLVWPEASLGSPIASAYYSHQVKKTSGLKYGSTKPYPVTHDAKNHRWYIPLQEIFEHDPLYTPEDVILDDQQTLILEVNLDNKTRKVFKIRFQAAGPMANVKVSLKPVILPKTPEMLIRKASKSGLVVYEEQLVNPTSRPFHIWVNMESPPGRLRLVSFLEEPRYQGFGDAAPKQIESYYAASNAILDIKELNVVHQNLKTEKFKLRQNQWENIVLEPFETLTLQWIALPTKPVTHCQLPPSRTETFNWVYIKESRPYVKVWLEWEFPAVGPGGWIDMPTPAEDMVPHYYSENKTIDWSFAAGNIFGTWDREIRLVHPFVSKVDATRGFISPGPSAPPIEYIILENDSIDIDIQLNAHGNVPHQVGMFTCQGVFP